MNTNIVIAIMIVINILITFCIIRLNNKVFNLSKAIMVLTSITPQGKVLIKLQEAVQRGDQEETIRLVEECRNLDDHIDVDMEKVEFMMRRKNRG